MPIVGLDLSWEVRVKFLCKDKEGGLKRLVCYEPEALIGDTDWEVVLCFLVPLWPYELYWCQSTYVFWGLPRPWVALSE